MQKLLAFRAIFFLILAVVIFFFALNMEDSWERTMFFAFAVLDIAWGGYLLSAYLKSRKFNN